MKWFKNLKKWQKGGLIGCGVGLLLAIMIIINYRNSLGGWIADCHEMCYTLPTLIALFGWDESSTGDAIIKYGGFVAIVIFYGGLGALFGRFQQIDNPAWKWLITALLVLLVLGFYIISYNSD